jgi:hypothetical protein
MKEPLNGWPFKTWTQGYILGIINGIILGVILTSIIFVLDILLKN